MDLATKKARFISNSAEYQRVHRWVVKQEGNKKKFPSAVIASKETGILKTAISNVLTGRSNTAGGYKWRAVL